MSTPLNPVTWFEIPVNNMDRAKKFYEAVFEVELSLNDLGGVLMAWFPMHPGAPNAMGTLIKEKSYTPSHSGTLVYFSTPDIEAALARVNANGGKTLNPKMSIGQYGFVGHFEDTEGNRVALHSMS
jgi:uncharacterized protein